MKTQIKIKHLLVMLALSSASQAQKMSDEFKNPPNAAKPRVWWHWMNGNITKDGIQKDLDWMTRIGIGGFQNFDANLFTPVIVPKKLVFMTPDWKDAFKFTTELAAKKGLEMAIAGSPGWSVTGGPWVEPKDGMKKYVWTETIVESGKTFTGKLSEPAGILSNFQNVALEEGLLGKYIGAKPTFYQDAAVIAFKNSASEKKLSSLKPKVSSSGGTFNLATLTDGDLNTSTYLPPKAVGEDMWIQYEFETPQTFKSLSVVGADHDALEQFNGSVENRSLKVSDDGINFREVTKIHGSLVPQTTVDFATTTAKYFRFAYKTLENKASGLAAMFGASGDSAPKGVNVAEFVLYNTNRINKFEDKAGFMAWQETSLNSANTVDAINANDVIDLSSKMTADGMLNWTPPANKGESWTIIRFGYSLTGRQNHPASPEATGLEVDKLDKVAVKNYINTYLDMYKDATGGLMGNKGGLQYMILDSYEAGHMNWTKEFPIEFKKRRGYDPLLWIPVLTGRYVKNSEATEKFLWDFRKTIGELIAENHYDVIGQELNKRGMKRYTESHENGRIYLADGMDVKKNAEIPMSAMWTPGSLAGGDSEEARSEGDIRESASVANIYGQNIVAAESMTSIQKAFSFHPEKLKRTADLEMASGLNRFVIHTSVHQPLDDKMPGFSLGPFGQYFTRQETWAEQAKAWTDYLARSCYMLQKGKNIADLLYYYGENQNITLLCKQNLPNIPAGYEFDFVNASALIDAMAVIDGKLVAKSGNTYRLLVLDQSAKYMTLTTLKRLQKLVKIGAKVVGTKPEQSPSLSDSPTEFQAILKDIWASKNVFTGSISDALKTLKVTEDVIVKNTTNKILFRHRKEFETEVYWLNNRSQNATNAEVSFNVTGKTPELWNPQTGISEKVAFQIKDGRTIVSLQFESWDAFFVVFKEKATVNSLSIQKQKEKDILTLNNPWQVSFQANRGAPVNAVFSDLKSLTESTETGIKYFSGTSTYQSTFNIQLPSSGLTILDLGEVKNIAEVTLNGKTLGIVWKKPFKIELGSALKNGENTIEIKVTNPWVNRLIGDAQPNVKDKITFTTMPFYRPDSPLLPSGLLGPVKILVRE